MICVEGVVGVGKTTLMNIIANEGYTQFEEPVVDNPILEKFYYDRKRWSFPLQIFFLNRRFRNIKLASELTNTIMDRSIYGDAIFARMLYLSNDMTEDEYMLYQELLENMLEHVKRPKLMIYLECSVDVAIDHIKKRGRDYEQVVERAYWEQLNHEYQEYFDQYNQSPILKINIDHLDFTQNEADRQLVLDLVNEKLKTL